ncbi:MAG: ParA family protein [Planctomycetota bacterium]
MFEYFESLFNENKKEQAENTPAEGMGVFPSSQINGAGKTSIIVIANQKGGCGKTTTCINLSTALAKMDLKVLIIDLDAQAQASLAVGIDTDKLKYSVYDVMVKNVELESVILPTKIKNLDIAPASSMLSGAELEIASVLGREWILRTSINKMLDTPGRNYDYIIMDCSPSLNLTTINGLASAKQILIPAQTHYFSLEGIKELLSTIKVVKERLNPDIEILGILPTLYDIRTRISRQILAQLRKHFKDKVFKTAIRNNIKLVEAQVHQQSMFEFAPNSNGLRDYLALSEEVVSRTRPELVLAKEKEKAAKVKDMIQGNTFSKVSCD